MGLVEGQQTHNSLIVKAMLLGETCVVFQFTYSRCSVCLALLGLNTSDRPSAVSGKKNRVTAEGLWTKMMADSKKSITFAVKNKALKQMEPQPIFIGRHAERSQLQEAMDSGKAECVAVFGRRRVGKT